MNVSLQSSRSNGWMSRTSATPLSVPLKSVATGKEVTVDIPATNVRGLTGGDVRPETPVPHRVWFILNSLLLCF